MTASPVYEVVVTAAGRVQAVTIEATDARAARRDALRACPWADARKHFVAIAARRLQYRRGRPFATGTLPAFDRHLSLPHRSAERE